MRPCVHLGLVVAIALAPPSHAEQAPDPGKPKYVERLDVPSKDDSIRFPTCVTADAHTDEVFVCDPRAQRILIFDGRGLFKFSLRAGDRYRSPTDLAVDPEGFLVALALVQGKTSIVNLDFDGLYLGTTEIRGAPEMERDPAFSSVALSPDGGTLFLVDQENRLLWRVSREGSFLGVTDLIPEIEGEERLEQVVAKVDVYGDTVLVAVPSLGQILLFDVEGRPTATVGLKGTARCQSAFPVAGAIDEDGNVWMIDKQRVIGTKWSVSDNRCLLEFSGIGRSAGALYAPDDIALDEHGRVYVAQGFEGRVQVFGGATPAAPPDLDGTPQETRSDGD